MPGGRPRKEPTIVEPTITEESLIEAVPEDKLTMEDYRAMWESTVKHTKQLQESIDQFIIREKDLLKQMEAERAYAKKVIDKLANHFTTRIDTIFNTVENLKVLMELPSFEEEKE